MSEEVVNGTDIASADTASADTPSADTRISREQAAQLTIKYLAQHNLADWHVRISTDYTRPWLALCSYRDKTIFLNAHHIDTHPSIEVEDSIWHEIAHALVGPGHAHDEMWQAKAKELGAKPFACSGMALDPRVIDAIRSSHIVEVTYEEHVTRTPKYTVTRLQDKCPECGKVAKEKMRSEIQGKIIIFLECGHAISRVAESFSPFETIISNWWKPEVASCQHEWIDNKCGKCGEYKLFPFQVEGARFLEKANGRAGVFDEMGLGKTVQSLAWLRFYLKEAGPVLFVVKSGIKFQWAKEVVRWLSFSAVPQVIQTSQDALIPGMKCYIISYGMLVPKVRMHKGKLITQGFDIEKFKTVGVKTIILDECQAIKNPDSTTTQMVRRVIRNGVLHIIPLSGTPWKNRGNELFPVMNMLDPARFPSHDGFCNRWVDYYWQGGFRKMGGIRYPDKFKEFVKDIMIRRERSEVMKQLPSISRNPYYCNMSKEHSELYDKEVAEFIKFWDNAVIGGEEDSFATSQGILARLTRMRHRTGLAKVPHTLEFAKEFLEETDRKLVIFVHHKDVGQIIYDKLVEFCAEENYPQPLRLTADLSSKQRFETQEKFNSPNYRIMVASTLASGEGLNLQTCADCIMHERQWNPANEEQAEGRFIRIGQQAEAVTATYMLAQGSIDDHFHGLVEQKRAWFHSAMNKGQATKWNESNLIKELGQKIVDSGRK